MTTNLPIDLHPNRSRWHMFFHAHREIYLPNVAKIFACAKRIPFTGFIRAGVSIDVALAESADALTISMHQLGDPPTLALASLLSATNHAQVMKAFRLAGHLCDNHDPLWFTWVYGEGWQVVNPSSLRSPTERIDNRDQPDTDLRPSHAGQSTTDDNTSAVANDIRDANRSRRFDHH